MEPLFYCHTPSPLGPLRLAGDGHRLWALDFTSSPHPGWREDPHPFAQAIAQLDGYFSGQLKRFTLPLRRVGTPFQLKVWAAMEAIPWGQTQTYGQLAARLNQPGAARAVGGACGANPLPIIVPCHRVLAAGGLGGYSSGLAIKQALLRLEGVI